LISDGWCELHCHSAYSLRDGVSRPDDLGRRAAELGYPALALTDHDSLAGIVAHARACAAAGVRPIAGVELTLDDGSHLTLLARDGVGYRSLCRLVSQAHLGGERERPRVALDLVAAWSAGLECLTGCRTGRVAAAILRGDEAGAAAALRALREIFGADHVWVEAQRYGAPDDGQVLHGLTELARRAGLPLVATGNAHYAHARDRDLQDVMTCIRHRVPLDRARPLLRPGAAWHLRSPAEVAARFAAAPGALRGAAILAERCGFDLSHVDAALPSVPVPDGQSAAGYLRHLTWSGAADRYGVDVGTTPVRARLEHELAVIERLGLAAYFLIVWDLAREARERRILAQGRGSAVGSAVCYCLGITAVEPLAHGLLFERFLSGGRADPPDIDLDIASDRPGTGLAREALIGYALARYAGHAALVANTITFRARSAIRDVGLALGLAPAQIDALARDQERDDVPSAQDDPPVGPRVGATGKRVLPGRRGAQAMGEGGDHPLDLPAGGMLRRLRALCARLDGLPRHLGQHPAGVVITARPLCEVAPLQRPAMEGRLIVQWDKDAAEIAGLVKIDLLGLGMLAAIDRCCDLIERQTGTRPALHGRRCDDPRVYDLLCAADTVGVFQLESRAQMTACLPQLRPRRYEDLIAAVALIRPGPLQGNATHPFLRRRQGLEPVHYPGGEAGRRLLEPVLGETLGVCLYQDQVIAVGVACGLDADEAAELRRAMSSARSAERMAALRGRLEEGLAAHGLDAAARAAVLDTVAAFAGYGFVKGHAAAFAYLAYVSAWFKLYHPAAFCAALLDMQPLGFYPIATLVQDAERHGVRVLPVDMRHSRADCAIEAGALRLGLRLVRGLGAEACARLEEALSPVPPADPADLCARARLEEDEARALARSGALRGYIPDRRQALWTAPLAARAARERWLPRLREAVDPPVALPRATEREDLALEQAALGLTPGRHVLAPLRADLAHRPLRRSGDLAGLPAGTRVEVVGQVISRQRPPTARGVFFLGLSDEWGLLNVVVPSEVYERDRRVARGEALVWVMGTVERRAGVATVRAERLRPLTAMFVGADAASPCDPWGDASAFGMQTGSCVR